MKNLSILATLLLAPLAVLNAGDCVQFERRVAMARGVQTQAGAQAQAAITRTGIGWRALLDALLDPKARLLVASSDARKVAQVRVAHEALLDAPEAATSEEPVTRPAPRLELDAPPQHPPARKDAAAAPTPAPAPAPARQASQPPHAQCRE